MTTTTTSTPLTTAPVTAAPAATVTNGNGSSSLRDRIRAAALVFPQETVEIPEWGVTVLVRSMSIAAKVALMDSATKADDDLALDVLLPGVVIATCCDPDTGARTFTADDTGWLVEQPAGLVERVAAIGLRVSGLDPGAAEGKSSGS